MKKVLVIEDDLRMSQAVARIFAGKFQVTQAMSGSEGLQLGTREVPDLVLLDLNLPDMDGFQVCRQFREQLSTRDVPIIMLSGSDSVGSRIEGLNRGADDYVCKPFHAQELEARVWARLRRKGADDDAHAPVRVGNLELDPQAAEASIDGASLELSHLQFQMLLYFCRNKDQLLSRQRILGDLWPDAVVSRRTIDTHVANLRKKLHGFSGSLETVYGGGYQLKAEL